MGILLAIAGSSQLARAQPISQDPAYPQWVTYFWHLQDTGSPHPNAATFSFSNTQFNSAGTLPLAQNILVHRSIYKDKLEASECAASNTVNAMFADPTIRESLRAYSQSKTVITPFSEPEAVVKNIVAAMDAAVSGETFIMASAIGEGQGTAWSSGLELVGVPVATEVALVPMPLGDAGALLTDLSSIAASMKANGFSGQIDPVAIIRGEKLGQTPADVVRQLIGDHHPDARVSSVVAVWGDHSSRVLAEVSIQGVVLVVDGIAGIAYGPFDESSTSASLSYLQKHGVVTLSTPSIATSQTAVAGCAASFPLVPKTPGPLPGTVPANPLSPWVPDAWDRCPWFVGCTNTPGPAGKNYKCSSIPSTGGQITCRCTASRTLRRVITPGTLWNDYQYAQETESCSAGPFQAPATCPAPPAGYLCVPTYEIY